jgi:hypothetical protein
MIKELEPLIRAIIDATLLLESAGPEEVDPDTAVRGLENMAHSLHALDQADQVALVAALRRIADGSSDPAYREFVHSMPAMFDLPM